MRQPPIVLWFWEKKDKRGRWRRLSWCMTDESAELYMQNHGIELRKIESTREEREDYYGNGYGQLSRN
jgi:hypothetical protein